jgi:hypothetical protein
MEYSPYKAIAQSRVDGHVLDRFWVSSTMFLCKTATASSPGRLDYVHNTCVIPMKNLSNKLSHINSAISRV